VPLYHTDLLMSIATNHAAVCLEVIEPKHRQVVRDSLRQHRLVIEHTAEQQRHMVLNAREVVNHDGVRLLAMSENAFAQLDVHEKAFYAKALGGQNRIIYAPVPTIERIGGGSMCCLMQQLHGVIAKRTGDETATNLGYAALPDQLQYE